MEKWEFNKHGNPFNKTEVHLLYRNKKIIAFAFSRINLIKEAKRKKLSGFADSKQMSALALSILAKSLYVATSKPFSA